MMKRQITSLIILTLVLATIGCGRSTAPKDNGNTTNADNGSGSPTQLEGKVLRYPIDSDGPKSMDPADGSTLYENQCVSQVYESLLQYNYLERPMALQPLLLEKMPEVSEDGLTYTFTLKKGVMFHDDPCFPEGKGRELVSTDVFYSWKRIANKSVSLKNWWLLENTIAGFDDYYAEQNEAEKFDYDAEVEGMQVVDDHVFKVVLQKPVSSFSWKLAMFQTAIVAREAVEKYGEKFSIHPVGTGAFRLAEKDWIPRKSMRLTKNPNYHETLEAEDIKEGVTSIAAGAKLPIVDGVEITFFVQEQPMWLQFRSGNLDYTRVPKDYFPEAFNKRTKKLKPEFREKGIGAYPYPMLDFIFFGFNMEDELVGGYSDKNKYLRQAISLAIDWDERNDVFYNNLSQIYDGPIPPGLEGYPEDGLAEKNYRGPDLPRARELLEKAGYPNGEGLPQLEYYTSLSGPGKEMAEMTVRQLNKIGIKVNTHLDVFSAFMENVNNRKAPFFSFAWHSDYPDAENNLALFYGPNEAPGSNHFNYKNEEFDKLYEQVRIMPPSPERTKLYIKMRDIVIEDSPCIGSMARTRYFLTNPWLINCQPTEDFTNWLKYLDIDESKRK